jgi:hypothetical protein
VVDPRLASVVQVVGMTGRKRKVYVRLIADRSIVHTIETELRGSSYDRFILGLLRKTDLQKYFVDEEEND